MIGTSSERADIMPLVSRFVLTTGTGVEIRNPLDEDLQNALDEVLEPQGTLLRQPPREQARLRLEQRSGTTVELKVLHNRDMLLCQWPTSTPGATPSAPMRLGSVSFDHALAIWRALRAGDISAVRHERWG